MKFRYRCIEGFAPRIDDDGPLWAQLIQLEAYGLADPPLDAISHHGFAEGARAGEANMRSLRLRFADTESRKQRSGEPGTLVINPAEIFGTQQTDTFRKTRYGDLPLRTDRKFLAATGAAASENSTAILGFHTGTEAMSLGAMAIIRLKSTFRHVSSIL